MTGLSFVGQPSQFLCSYNNVRRAGDAAAHSAAKEDMKSAVMSKNIDSQERQFLDQLYTFVFSERI
jgi:hypothetical protein